jgi:DNA-binding NarL/FixJ family response regulator
MRVAILCQICVYGEAIGEVLGRRPGFAVLGYAPPDTAGIGRIRRLEPDVALLDVTPPGALCALPDVTTGLPGIPTVAIGALETDDVLACLEAGVAACVPRHDDVVRLVETLGEVARGGVVCSPAITGSLFRRLAALADERRGLPPAEPLTLREREIASLLAEGLSNREIGRRLFIEVSTVKNHVHSILDKLQLHGRADAASWFSRTHEARGCLPGQRTHLPRSSLDPLAHVADRARRR